MEQKQEFIEIASSKSTYEIPPKQKDEEIKFETYPKPEYSNKKV